MIPDSVRTRQIGSTPRSALLSSMNESMTPSGAHTPPGAQTRARPAQDLIGPPPARAPPTPAPRSAAPRRRWFPAGRPDRSRPERAGPPGGRPAPSAIRRTAPRPVRVGPPPPDATPVTRSRSSNEYFLESHSSDPSCHHRLHQTRNDSPRVGPEASRTRPGPSGRPLRRSSPPGAGAGPEGADSEDGDEDLHAAVELATGRVTLFVIKDSLRIKEPPRFVRV